MSPAVLNLYIRKNTVMLQLVVLALLFSQIQAVQASESEMSDTDQVEFDRLVRRLDYNPDDLKVGDKLRDLCRRNDASARCIDALNDLVDKHLKNKALRYQAALAYVDEVPGHSLFRQGWLSSRSMDHMSEVIEREPGDWAAYYIRGLNGLYWPRSFRKLPKAVKDLNQCIAFSEKLPKGLQRPYHGLAYIALGDAHVKDGDLEQGRKAYKRGVELFESDEMQKRLDMDDQALMEYVKKFRHTDQKVDTEISFLIDGGADKL